MQQIDLTQPFDASSFEAKQEDEDGPSPIGVPEDFRVQTFPNAQFRSRGNLTPVERNAGRPQYFEGDELEIARWSTPQTVAWQQAMDEVGLLTGNYTLGAPDNKTTTAYKNLLAVANRLGQTPDQVLGGMLSAQSQFGSGSGGGGGGARALPIRLSNPDDLKKAFGRVARETTGVGHADDELLDRMVAAFQEAERSFQTQANTQSGGTITDAPSFETFAEKFIDESQPGGRAAKKYADAAQVMMQSMGATV